MKVPLGTAVIVMKESRKETQRCAVVGTEVVKVKKRNVNDLFLCRCSILRQRAHMCASLKRPKRVPPNTPP